MIFVFSLSSYLLPDTKTSYLFYYTQFPARVLIFPDKAIILPNHPRLTYLPDNAYHGRLARLDFLG